MTKELAGSFAQTGLGFFFEIENSKREVPSHDL